MLGVAKIKILEVIEGKKTLYNFEKEKILNIIDEIQGRGE